MAKKRRTRVKRGHPVSLLVGLHENNAIIWRIFSETIKQEIIIKRNRKRQYQDSKQLYHFHEAIIDQLRKLIKEGIKSALLISPPKKEYAKEFMNHIQKHHSWLLRKGENSAVFSTIEGSAKNIEEVSALIRQDNFKEEVNEISNQEALLILEDLNELMYKSDNFSSILYTLEEIEKEINKKRNSNEINPSYIILTDEYLENPRRKNRVYRILQIAKNYGIKTKIVNAESDAGIKVKSFGGLVCFTKIN